MCDSMNYPASREKFYTPQRASQGRPSTMGDRVQYGICQKYRDMIGLETFTGGRGSTVC
jgi:hypothetical protein